MFKGSSLSMTYVNTNTKTIDLNVFNNLTRWPSCTDAVTRVKPSASVTPLSSRAPSEVKGQTQSASNAPVSTQTTRSTSSSSLHKTIGWEAEPARSVGAARGSAGGTRVLIIKKMKAVQKIQVKPLRVFGSCLFPLFIFAAKVILITSTCALLLTAVIIAVYLKL